MNIGLNAAYRRCLIISDNCFSGHMFCDRNERTAAAISILASLLETVGCICSVLAVIIFT
ncbi:MAG: hypothetical protein M3Z67_09400 [Commensalibacter sp.]|nr:hypothetical protein [Commensalibacter sp.]